MRIAIMGAGGVGGCLGAKLARVGNDVTLIARGPNLQAIQDNGLQFKQGAEEFTVQVPATDDPSEVGPVELVVFAVKTYHNAEAIPSIKPMVGNKTAVLTLQNGVDSHEQLAAVLGPGHVLIPS